MPSSDADRGPARAAERVPVPLGPQVAAIVAHTDAFAAAHLDDEYAALGRRMTTELARLRPSPLARGEARTWAAAIMHAVGWVNFLADPSQRPHLPTADLARLTGVGQTTLSAYLRTIRTALDLVRLEPRVDAPEPAGRQPARVARRGRRARAGHQRCPARFTGSGSARGRDPLPPRGRPAQ